MIENWERALEFVWLLDNSGAGYRYEPHATGSSNKGVTHHVWQANVRANHVAGPLCDATNDALAKVLKQHYWDALNGDNLPAGVDIVVFNFAMVTTPERAAYTLQAALGMRIGAPINQKEIDELNRVDNIPLILHFTAEASNFHKMPKKDWNRRAAAVRDIAFQVAGLA